MRVGTDVGKQLHMQPFHPTLSEHQDFSQGTLRNGTMNRMRMWACALGKRQTVLFMCVLFQESTAAALVANSLLKAMRNFTDDTDMKQRLQKNAEWVQLYFVRCDIWMFHILHGTVKCLYQKLAFGLPSSKSRVTRLCFCDPGGPLGSALIDNGLVLSCPLMPVFVWLTMSLFFPFKCWSFCCPMSCVRASPWYLFSVNGTYYLFQWVLGPVCIFSMFVYFISVYLCDLALSSRHSCV